MMGDKQTGGTVTETVGALLDGVRIYKDIGVTDDGRSHHYDPDAHEIVVCVGDSRGVGMDDGDIQRRIPVPEGSEGAWDYVQFVREEVDGVAWTEVDVPEQPPEADQ